MNLAPNPTSAPELAELLSTWRVALLEVLPWLILAAGFATLRKSLQRSVSSRILGAEPDAESRERLRPLLAKTDSFQTSAGVFEVASRSAFAVFLVRALSRSSGSIGWTEIGLTIAIAVPTLLLCCDALATALAIRRGEAIVRAALPPFHFLQMPVRWVVRGLEGARAALMRVVGLRQNPSDARRIVEGLREVIEESDISRELDETEREIISNIMEFRDVDVAAIMTPRTEVIGIEVGETLEGATRILATNGHSRIPAYEGSLDTIVGVLAARDVVQAAAEEGLGGGIKPWLRAAYFVPETKPISELLTEMRREKFKIAIVLDEYGGTAGIVTVGDILREIVGHIGDEFDEPEVQPIRHLPDGTVEVDASLHVSEVNKELELDIPEGDDFETLAGFVLSEMGHFPKRGESFTARGQEYTIVEANDRRVLKVAIRILRRKASA
ncbi:MAG: HlyC/CorC family transporter [Planctomycetes bacterium]|nr:HlyC/CorC family transporter [Planctomycetota bacterium]